MRNTKFVCGAQLCYLLRQVCTTHTSEGESMFCFSSVKIWNSLPKYVRECDKLTIFKSKFKSHYFGVAFEDVPDL